MEIVVSGQEAKNIDYQAITNFHIPDIVLMEIAGERIFQKIVRRKITSLGFLVGKGNNGGDAVVIARKFFEQGKAVTLFLLAEENANLSPLLQTQLAIAQKIGIPITLISNTEQLERHKEIILSFPYLIDGLLGIGLKQPARGIIQEIIEILNKNYKGKIFAIDVPSGLSGTQEFFTPVLKAFQTFTIEMPKLHMLDYPGKAYTGKITIVPIGFPPQLKNNTPYFWVRKNDIILPTRKRDMHKGNTGKCLILAGSSRYTGAALLSIRSALKSGVGLIFYYGEAAPLIQNQFPDVIVLKSLDDDLNRFSSVLIGPGWDSGNRTVLRTFLEKYQGNLILDADALNLLARERELLQDRKMLLTPHIQEFARLTQKDSAWIKTNKVLALEDFMKLFPNIRVLLKDSVSLFAEEGKIYYLSWGSSLLARGGSGDLLAGLITGFAAQLSLRDAVFTASYIQGKTAEILSQKYTDFSIHPSLLPDYYYLAFEKIKKKKK